MGIESRIFELFKTKGRARYFGEPVSQTHHALQTAFFARQSGATSSLVVAALLHDIGHLLHGDETAAYFGIDVRHEDIGANWLDVYFGPEVSKPVRLHVAAKRYLCATDHGYLGCLSEASILSLELQGGPFGTEDANVFATSEWADDAIKLRLWDDRAKILDLEVPSLDSYADDLRARGLLTGHI